MLGRRTLVVLGAVLAAAALAVVFIRSGGDPEPGLDEGAAEARAERDYGKLPLAFEPNAGRYPGRLRYRARSASGSVELTDSGAELLVARQAQTAGYPGAQGIGERASARQPKRQNRFAFEFAGGSPKSIAAADKLDGVVNDLRGDDPARYKTGIPTYGAVRYKRVWPGIDAVYHGTQRRLIYDFHLAPGADPNDIAVRVRGADRLRLAENGDLLITVGGSSFRQKAPVSFQPASDGDPRTPVKSRYTLEGNRIALAIGDYDRNRPLLVDPVVLTYFDYAGSDALSDIAVDASGSAYVVGYHFWSDYASSNDVFVGKYAPDGESLVYSTYLGSNDDGDYGSSIAIDGAGAAYVTGYTYSSEFPTVNEMQACTGASTDSEAFVLKLAPNGSSLAYSTCLGGSHLDYGLGIALDMSGSAYVTGYTYSSDFPTVNEIDINESEADAFVSKLAPNGSSLIYSTYLGGNDEDYGEGIAVDSSGSAYVTGETDSTDFNRVGGIEGDEGGTDVFISKLAPNGSSLTYSTYLGGSTDDRGNGIAVDSSGSAYVTGETDSTDFNRVGGIEGDEGGTDVFISKLAPNGSSLAYSTYLGGGGIDSATDIAVDATGSAHVTGGTASDDFGADGWIDGHYYLFDVFVFQILPEGDSLVYSIVTSEDVSESGLGVAVDASGDTYAIDSSGWTMKLVYTAPPDTTPPDTQIDSGPTGTITTDRATFTFSGTPAEDTAKIQCHIDNQPFADCTSPKTFTGLTEGSHTASFRAEDAVGNQDQTPATRTFTVDTTTPPDNPTTPPDNLVYRAKISKVRVSGPAKVKRGKKVTYKVKITNSGNKTATGVRLKVRGRGVSFNTSVGKIGAKKTRTVKVRLKAKKPGKVKVAFKVTSKNAGGKTVKKKITVRK